MKRAQGAKKQAGPLLLVCCHRRLPFLTRTQSLCMEQQVTNPWRTVLSGNRRRSCSFVEHRIAREINESIDASVFERWRSDHGYRPQNLRGWAQKYKVDPGILMHAVRADDPSKPV